MSESFEGFLKKQVKNNFSYFSTEKKIIRVKDLGKYFLNEALDLLDIIYSETPKRFRCNFDAIEEYVENINFKKVLKKKQGLFSVYDLYFAKCWNNAKSCLGKGELRHLLELKK